MKHRCIAEFFLYLRAYSTILLNNLKQFMILISIV